MALIPLVSAIFVLILGIFVFLKNKTSLQNILFFLFSVTIFTWLFGAFMLFRVSDNDSAIFWDRFIYAGAVFIPSLLYHFSIVFTETSRQKISLRLSYVLSIVFLFASRTDYFVKGIFKYKWGLHTIAQPLHHVFLIVFWINVFIAIYNIYYFRKTSANESKRKQASYILFAILILFTIGAFAYLPAYKISIYPFPSIGGLLFVIVLAYAILAHRLLDINIVFRKITGYSLLIALLFVLSVTILFFASRFFGQFFLRQTMWSTLFTITILALVFQPLYRWTNAQIDKWFFKGTLPQISKEKDQIETELRRSERLAAIGMLASGLLHEIKNPLVPIRVKIEQLKDPDNLINKEFIQKLTTAIPYEIDRITGLLGQLKEFASPATLEVRQVNIEHIFDDRLNLLKEILSQRNIKLVKQYTASGVSGDQNKLGQVFLNLFQNAIDAMPQGGTLTVSCEQSLMPGQNSTQTVLLKVHDTGFGIPKEDMNKIFDPFFTKKKSGTGLGLAVSHQIIKSHNGIIHVDSILGEGTTFYVYLPL